MLLILRHPKVAWRSCDDCKRWRYDEKTGKRELWRSQPIERPPKTRLPCQILQANGESRCHKGSPNAGRVLTRKNLEAYEHYLQCRACGSFPDDPIVRRNAAVIRSVEDFVADQRHHEQLIELFEVVLKLRT